VSTATCKVRNPAHVIPTGLSEHIVETTYFDQTSIVSYTMFDTFPTIRSPLSKVISKKCHHPMLVQSKWDLGSSLDMDLPFSKCNVHLHLAAHDFSIAPVNESSPPTYFFHKIQP